MGDASTGQTDTTATTPEPVVAPPATERNGASHRSCQVDHAQLHAQMRDLEARVLASAGPKPVTEPAAPVSERRSLGATIGALAALAGIVVAVLAIIRFREERARG